MEARRSREIRHIGPALALLALLAGRPALQPLGAQAPPNPPAALPVEAALKVRELPGLSSIDLSPDGRSVAYALLDPERLDTQASALHRYFGPTGVPARHHGAAVWVTDTVTRETIRVTGQGSAWAPAWSPDGQRLAFYWDSGGESSLWIWDRASRRTRRAAAIVTWNYMAIEAPVWFRDARRVLTRALPPTRSIAEAVRLTVGAPAAAAAEPDTPAVVVFRSGLDDPATPVVERQPSFLHAGRGDLVVVDVDSGDVRTVVRDAVARWFRVSPDERHIAWMEHRGFDTAGGSQPVYRLNVVPLTSGSPRVLADGIPHGNVGLSYSWSPDSRSLAYTSDPRAEPGDVFLVPLDGAPRNLSETIEDGLGEDYRPPLWSEGGEALLMLSNERFWRIPVAGGTARSVPLPDGLLAGTILHGRDDARPWTPDRLPVVTAVEFASRDAVMLSVDVGRGRMDVLRSEPRTYSDLAADVSEDGRTLAVVSQAAHDPPDVWLFPSGPADPPVRVTHFNPALEGIEFGRSRTVAWTTERGQQLRGALLLPAGYREGTRYPVIVQPYGTARFSNRVHQFGLFGAEFQLLATRGYAVLAPDIPLRFGHPMEDTVDAVEGALDRLDALGIANGRVGLYGHSYGGYSVLALLTSSPRFHAGVVAAGIVDLVGAYAELRDDGMAYGVGFAESGHLRMGKTPWQEPQGYLRNSPFFLLDRVTAPVLIAHGTGDINVPLAQSDRMFVALRRLGKRVEYVRYVDEHHVPSAWSFANQRDFWSRVIGWFERWVKSA